MTGRWYIYGWQKAVLDSTLSKVSVPSAHAVLDAKPGDFAGELAPGDQGFDGNRVTRAKE